MRVKSRKAIEPSTGHKWKEMSSENNKQEKIKIIKFDFNNVIIEM